MSSGFNAHELLLKIRSSTQNLGNTNASEEPTENVFQKASLTVPKANSSLSTAVTQPPSSQIKTASKKVTNQQEVFMISYRTYL